ncbi:M1 family metallopeptidase [Wenjunlia tyrosinilytica]|uniref:Aminopeptidase N n=1 Tax=Wenjunlia tyrosinilytica TaxID=1544741 RepID=A0A918DYQ1_9ACTN|nr:M1 family metallopeptidase [Wenjunlia tyrosinilytica]GGO91473.1 zinc metalloprotease [Wenjunlia tyrosinilytica]
MPTRIDSVRVIAARLLPSRGASVRRTAAAVIALAAFAPAAFVPAASAVTATAPPVEVPGPGAAGVGDRLYPQLGNGGYDVRSYDISLDYRDKDRPLDAVTRISATATRALNRFNLDFARGEVRDLRVNGLPAAFRREGEELEISPVLPIAKDGTIRIEVHHTSDPAVDVRQGGWLPTGDGLAMANQADAAHRVFPCSDHPSDKAVFTFHVTAPRALTVVANGTRRDHAFVGDRATWTYRTAHPMATELAQVSIGDSAVVRRTGPHGLELRDVVPKKDAAALEPRLAMTPGQIAWMERRVGRFPFETYGVLSADATTGFELETQTLSLFERQVMLMREEVVAPLMVHELAHQWFGDSVSPADWSDLWLNEGHATWYEWTYAADKEGVDLTALLRAAYAADPKLRRQGGPPAAPLAPGADGKLGIFRGNVYSGGALVLYALRQRIGVAAFEKLERAWVADHRDGTASTADFIALASKVSGSDQKAFLRDWLYGTDTPPMPGHQDWTADSGDAPPAAAGQPPRSGHRSAPAGPAGSEGKSE